MMTNSNRIIHQQSSKSEREPSSSRTVNRPPSPSPRKNSRRNSFSTSFKTDYETMKLFIVFSFSNIPHSWFLSSISSFSLLFKRSSLVSPTKGCTPFLYFSQIESAPSCSSKAAVGCSYLPTMMPHSVDAHFSTLNWVFSKTSWMFSSAMK